MPPSDNNHYTNTNMLAPVSQAATAVSALRAAAPLGATILAPLAAALVTSKLPARFARFMSTPAAAAPAAPALSSTPSPLTEVPPPHGAFDPQFRLVILAAGTAASGNTPRLLRVFEHLDATHRPAATEAVLQNIVLTGCPRVINAMVELSHAGVIPPREQLIREAAMPATPPEEKALSLYRARGVETFNAVYGPDTAKTIKRIDKAHDDLARWVTEFTYGRVLGRPGLDVKTRELCTIGVLCGMNLPAITIGHMRGCMRNGATKEEVRTVLDNTEWVWGPDYLESVKGIWKTFEEKGYYKL